jgi:triacylglycerol lipase
MNAASLIGLPPIWREGRVGAEVRNLLRDPVWTGEGVEDARDQPVLLIPGFMAGDDSLGLMTKWLRRTGHRTRRAGIRFNVDCSSASLDRVTRPLEHLAEAAGRRVAIVGQSRGGALARVLAVRRPDLVSGIVALGSPITDPLAVHPLVRFQVRAVSRLGGLGIPGLFTDDCLSGPCCREFWEHLQAPFPSDVGFLSLYSPSDGIVDWRACLDSAADCVKVDSSHCGMSANAQAYRLIAGALAEFRAGEAWAPPLAEAA